MLFNIWAIRGLVFPVNLHAWAHIRLHDQYNANAPILRTWLRTSNSFENGNFWQTWPHLRRKTDISRFLVRFLATGIIWKRNSWATTYEKRSKFYRLIFWQYQFAFIKANFWWFAFLQTPADAPSHHLKVILLWENIVPRSRTNCAFQNQWLLCFQLQPYTATFIILFRWHGNHSNHALWSAADYL